MEDSAQVKAAIPRELKRRAFAAFALREEKFNRWLRTQLEQSARGTPGHRGRASVSGSGWI